MIFFNNEKVYYNCFNFLISDYDYHITHINKEKGLFYSEIILEKENTSKIRIIIERGCLELDLYVEDVPIGIDLIYKFLHHDEIVKSSIFGNSTYIKKYFEITVRKYLDEILPICSTLKAKDIDAFYHEFPFYVFKWS